MKKCAENRLLISRYIDSDIMDYAQKIELEEHLKICDECKKTYNQYKTIRDILDVSFDITENADNKLLTNRNSHISHLRWSLRVAAILTLSLSIMSIVILSLTKQNIRNLSVTVQQDCLPMMNFPLGALVYYESVSGDIIQDQFTRVNTDYLRSGYFSNTVESLNYQSSLFIEN